MNNAGDQLVDIIDDSGNVVAVTTRREMRQRRLPHRCVYLLVFDSAGRLFIHQRTATKDVFPSYWDLCVGGVLVSGESFDVGARREGREELGVDLELELLFPFKYSDKQTTVQAMVYRAVNNGPFFLQPEELQTGRFIDSHDLPDWLAEHPFCPDGLLVWDTFLRRGEGQKK